MSTGPQRICPTCGNELSGAMEFCPVCMLRKGLAGGVESGESSFEKAARPTPDQPAQRFDHYELVMGEDGKPLELGRGAMGVTYKAFDINLRCTVTLKVISERYLGDESAQLRFLREARAAARLRHSNVASVLHLAKWARQKTYCQHLRARRKSKLDPLQAFIQRWLEQHPYSAAQVFQRLRAEEAYSGGISILTDYVRRVRPVRAPAFLTLVFAPGECAQVDWGCAGSMAIGSTRRRLSFFVMVLCYSRLCYVEFTLGEATEHFLAAHQNALEFFGRVPAKIIIDNPKTAVLKHPAGERPLFHPRYLDFAAHYGFEPRACNVRRPNEKGRVESGVGYVNPPRRTQRPATASRLERTEHCCTPLDGYGCQCPHSRGNAQTTERTLRTGKAAFKRVAAASRRHRSHPDCTNQQPLPCGVGYQPLFGSQPLCFPAAATQNLCRSALHLPRREADRHPHPQLRPASGLRRSRARQGTARSAPGSTRGQTAAALLWPLSPCRRVLPPA